MAEKVNKNMKFFKTTKECSTNRVFKLKCEIEFRNDGQIILTSKDVTPPANHCLFFCGDFEELKTLINDIFEKKCKYRKG